VVLVSCRQFHDELIHFRIRDRKFNVEPAPRSDDKLADVNTPSTKQLVREFFPLCRNQRVRSYAYDGIHFFFFSFFSFTHRSRLSSRRTRNRRGETARNARLRGTRQIGDTIRKICILLVKSHNHAVIDFYLYEKNDFAEVSKNLARYRSENNFVWTSK